MRLHLIEFKPSPKLWILTLAIVGLASSGLGAEHPALEKNSRPEDLGWQPSRESFDCTARDTFLVGPGFEMVLRDSTLDSDNNLSGYGCRNWNEMGPENIYRLELERDLELFAALRSFEDPESTPAQDLDIFLLGDCDSDNCLAYGNLEFSIILESGQIYYLVVDGYGTSDLTTGRYSLVLQTREPGLPSLVCEPGSSTPVIAGTDTIPFSGNLFDQPNLMQNHDCSPILERGGEIWYEVTVSPHHGFNVEISDLPETLDAAIWVFDTCGPDAICLGFSDDKLAGEAETLYFTNDTGFPIVVLLGVDSYRPVEESGLGQFTATFSGISNVPTEPSTLGGVRTLFH